ncbi:dehydrogenases with different specificities [alpha proteobacterium U9-1i]|nr:dehydrogenases with different specificities [alpha proteobacterium U9-1i]
MDFTGKNVLVVGGSSGIGNGVAHAFRARGAEVHVWGTRAAASDYKAEEGSDLTGLGYTSVDVSDPDAIANAPAPFPTLDVLILSQGTVLYGQKEFQRAGWDKVMAVNVDSVLHCATKFKPQLADAKGAIVVVNSVAGFKATVGNPAYSASKAGAVGLTKTLGQAWAPLGIRVNGFAPGLVDTKLTKVTMDHPDRREKALAKFPLGRFGTVEDMAGVALFLASPLSAYVVGQTLLVDGGLTL